MRPDLETLWSNKDYKSLYNTVLKKGNTNKWIMENYYNFQSQKYLRTCSEWYNVMEHTQDECRLKKIKIKIQ